jgi:hypothetical protein
MISLIPSRQISITTNHSIDVAISLISHIAFTKPLSVFQRFIWFDQFGILYEGYVSPDGFRISGRFTAWGSPFLTILEGKFTPTPNGVHVNIHSTTRPIAIIFLLSCLIGIVLILSNLTYNWVITGNFFNERAYVALGSLIFLYVMFYGLVHASHYAAEQVMVWLFRKKGV